MNFQDFLIQLKTPENENLISIVESGYNAIFEYPHVVTHDDEYADLYIDRPDFEIPSIIIASDERKVE